MERLASFLSGENGPFIAHLYETYLASPEAVPLTWQHFFASLEESKQGVIADYRGASWAPKPSYGEPAREPVHPISSSSGGCSPQALQESIRAFMLIRAYRVKGHLAAQLDPLKLEQKVLHRDLDPVTYGFRFDEGDHPLFLDHAVGAEPMSLNQMVEKMRKTYCGTLGIEFMHIQEPKEKAWIQDAVENHHLPLNIDPALQRKILEDLVSAEAFERFLAVKYPAGKRFGLEGGESLIPGLVQALKRAGEKDTQQIVLGMSHRGRLNVLSNIMGISGVSIFSQFQGKSAYPEDVQGSGDVKYHLGASADKNFGSQTLHLSLTANPSHLESVNPVVLGKVRAKQEQLEDEDRRKVLGILIHGDAAFAGQGIVAESLILSNLQGYCTGGTLHIIINNQIGFTTMPELSRSSTYCSDVAKMIQAPIFHVNGDDPEAVAQAMVLALDFLKRFQKDVVVDLVCYRRQGHNEIDEPSFTQPLMYQAIDQHPTTREIYEKKLIDSGVISESAAQEILKKRQDVLQKEFEEAASYVPSKADWLEGSWVGLLTATPEMLANEPATGVAEQTLKAIGASLAQVPHSFALHPKLKRFLAHRLEMVDGKSPVDWAMGEALAFGTLLLEGTPVRLSGQDSARGTFTQRHAVLINQETAERYVSLNHLKAQKAMIDVLDSPLSEAGVLGFELGYSLADPHSLVLWEAQFGDFANGAQVIIDQYIAAGESKWLRMSGLVLLLPHGYEGQGPEHSSARLERCLQLCAENNLQVVNCSTPANYFHVLRRQMHRLFRKPLIVMTPKSLLRNRHAVSSLADMATGTTFRPVIGDPFVDPQKVERVVLCSGKVYYDLLLKRETLENQQVALVRLEQFYPFPHEALLQELMRYPKAAVFWCQEEPENNGAWSFLDRRLEDVMRKRDGASTRVLYVGRLESAATATGSQSRHLAEQEALIMKALVG